MLKRLKTYFHCFKCAGFRKCQIKFCPIGKPIYMNCKVKDGILTLSDPRHCKNPMKSL